MTIEEAITQALKNWPALAGVVVRPDKVEQGDSPPYAVYQKIAGKRTQSLTGDSGLVRYMFQIDVYATSRLSATTLRKETRKAMQAAFQAIQLDEGAGFEPETRLFRERVDFAIWFND